MIIKAFHGGHMTGMACRTFLNKVDNIMDDISKECETRRLQREREGLPIKTVNRKELKGKIQLYKETFQVLDAVFGGLRTIAPTPEETDMTRRAIILLKYYWKWLKLSETPKFHTTTEHAVDNGDGDMETFGGLGDKNDEWGEKWHQTMAKATERTRTMGGGHRAQAKAIINSLWRNSHPDVRKSLEEGLEKNARGNYKVEDSTKKRREARWANVVRLESKKLPRNGQL